MLQPLDMYNTTLHIRINARVLLFRKIQSTPQSIYIGDAEDPQQDSSFLMQRCTSSKFKLGATLKNSLRPTHSSPAPARGASGSEPPEGLANCPFEAEPLR